MSDHTPYNFPNRDRYPQRVSLTSKQLQDFHAYQSVLVTIGKNCHAKGRKLTLRICSQLRQVDHMSLKFPQFSRCFYNKIDQFSVDLLHLWLEVPLLDLLTRNFWREKFHGNNFCELVLDRENRENFCLAKIFCYTVHDNLFLVLSQHSMSSWQLTVSMHQIGSLVCNQHDKLTILYLTV